jgi:KTSC domain
VEEVPFAPSSILASVRYDAGAAVLEVDLQNGTSYRYFLVPRSVVSALSSAPSAGAFFNQHIRTRFRYERIE